MRKNILRLLLMVSFLCLLIVLPACSSSPWTLFPTKINAQILASFDINPDATGRPSPLVVRVYELKSNQTFDDADFFQLYDDEAATLGGDLLTREEFELSPGEGREIIRKTNEQARYIGVVAAYRNIDQARWGASSVLELNSKNTLVIRIREQTVTINHR